MSDQKSAADDALDKALQSLGEHYENVQIFVSCFDTDEIGEKQTLTVSAGRGNLMARVGQVWDWMRRMDEEIRLNQRRKRNIRLRDAGEAGEADDCELGMDDDI